MTQILITGGAGYLGSMLYLKLKELGYNPVIYDSLMYNQKSLERINLILREKINVAESLAADTRKTSKIDYINGDIRDKERLSKLFRKHNFDFVFHFADIVGYFPCEENKEESHEISTEGTRIIAELCREYNSKLIYNSSSSIYGLSKSENLIDEGYEIREIKDQYSKNKLECEKIIKEIDPEYVILRPATIGGLSPRARPDLLPNHFSYMVWLKRNISVSNPNHYRALIDIRDMMDAYINIINNFKKGTYNLGSLNLTKIEIINKIKELVEETNIKVVDDLGDVRNLKINSAKFEKTFGFKPKYEAEEMLLPVIDLLESKGDIITKQEFLNITREQWEKLLE
ncbi:MAG: NAD(P)-dependent oxidoreductase [Candidatus Nanoarchaeia archaeon]|nr:NAD(P)-dependent oxidoreductase [Candidatus Nanoarchaeia archaeon]